MAGSKPCGTCRNCVRGYAYRRLAPMTMGVNYNSAWAEYVVVSGVLLTEVSDHVPFEQAAILTEAVATTSLPIIALDPNEAARHRVLELGADHVLDPTAKGAEQELWRLTDGLGLDVAVDLVGANRVLAEGDACLGRYGRLVMIGLSMEPIALGAGAAFGVKSHALLGHLGYESEHLGQLVTLVASGRLDVSRSVSEVMPLEQVARGVERLAKKEDNPIRLVVAP